MELLPAEAPRPEEAVTDEASETAEHAASPENPQAEEVSILAVRDTVLFPNALLPLSVGRPASVVHRLDACCDLVHDLDSISA